MTNVKSIYGSYENSNAEEAEVIIKTQMDECFEHFLSLMEDLIIEDNRNKKNLRYIRSEKLLVNVRNMKSTSLMGDDQSTIVKSIY